MGDVSVREGIDATFDRNLKAASRWNECSNGPRSNCELVRSSGGVSEAQDVEL